MNHINSQPGALSERAKLVVNGLRLDRVEWDERRLARALVAHVLDAVNSRLLLVDHDGVNIPTEHDRHRSLVLALRGLTEVYHTPTDTREYTLQIRERLLEPRFTLRLLLVYTRLGELLVDVD